jgi:CRISPR-associated protein Csb3
MIQINVDPANPGQFFACCGLFELADRLWPGCETWFDKSGMEFSIGHSAREDLDAGALLHERSSPFAETGFARGTITMG